MATRVSQHSSAMCVAELTSLKSRNLDLNLDTNTYNENLPYLLCLLLCVCVGPEAAEPVSGV